MLFCDTLRNNLDYDGEYSNKKLIDLVNKAGLHELLARGNGLDQMIEEGGSNVSVGEK